jgi:hypothetical protein
MLAYLKGIFSSEQYQRMTDAGKKSVQDYVYKERVTPAFQKYGLEVPGQDEFYAGQFNFKKKKDDTRPDFEIGVTKGLVKSAAGIARTFLDTVGTQVSIFDTKQGSKYKSASTWIDKQDKNIEAFLDDIYGEPEGIDALQEGVGIAVGMAPSFLLARKALTSVPSLGQMAHGGAAVPTFIGRVPSPLRNIIASRGFQRSIYEALEGAATAPLSNERENTIQFATIGAVLGPIAPPILNGLVKTGKFTISNLKKPFQYIYQLRGKQGVADVLEMAENVASGAKTLEAKTPEEALIVATAEVIKKDGNDVAERVTQFIKEPDDEILEELAVAEHEAITQVSNPAAQSLSKQISEAATNVGVETPAQRLASTAKADMQKRILQQKLEQASKTETVEELDSTINEQLTAMIEGRKPGVVLPHGKKTKFTVAIPDHIRVQKFSDGTIVFYNTHLISAGKIKNAKFRNRLDEILDYPQSKQEVAAAVEAGETAVAVTAKDVATGTEKETVVASTSGVVETVEAVQKHFPEAEVEVLTAQEGAEVVKQRAVAKLLHDFNNVWTPATTNAYLGKSFELDEAALAKIEAAKKAALDAGVGEKELAEHLAKAEARVQELIEKAKAHRAKVEKVTPRATSMESENAVTAVAAKTDAQAQEEQIRQLAEFAGLTKKTDDVVGSAEGAASDTALFQQAKAELGPEATLSAVAQRAQELKNTAKPTAKTVVETVDKEAKETARIFRFELQDGWPESEKSVRERIYRDILEKRGYKSSKEVPPSEREAIRIEILAAVVKDHGPFYATPEGFYTNAPVEGAEKVLLKPTKVLDMDTTFNPTFTSEVAKEHADVITSTDAQEIFIALQKKLGQESLEGWLKNAGYDLLKQGRPGKGEDIIAQVLNPDIVATPTKQSTKKLVKTAEAIGAATPEQGQSILETLNKVEDFVKQNKPKVRKFDVRGKEITE